LAAMVKNARIEMALNVNHADAFHKLANLMAAYSKGKGQLVAHVTHNDADIPVILGNYFQLDGDIAEKIAQIDGINNISIGPMRAQL